MKADSAIRLEFRVYACFTPYAVEEWIIWSEKADGCCKSFVTHLTAWFAVIAGQRSNRSLLERRLGVIPPQPSQPRLSSANGRNGDRRRAVRETRARSLFHAAEGLARFPPWKEVERGWCLT